MTDECASGEHVDCSRVLAELEVFLDGEIGDEAKIREFTSHLGDCPPCKDKADLEECVRELVKSRCVEEAPAELKARLLTRLAEWST